MDEALVIEIIKWILIVFIAGFIGYFGRHLGKILIAKFGKKQKQEQAQTIIHKHESAEKYKAEAIKARAKLEKKKLKLEKKRLKTLKKRKKGK